jgi:hypothetical protein
MAKFELLDQRVSSWQLLRRSVDTVYSRGAIRRALVQRSDEAETRKHGHYDPVLWAVLYGRNVAWLLKQPRVLLEGLLPQRLLVVAALDELWDQTFGLAALIDVPVEYLVRGLLNVRARFL